MPGHGPIPADAVRALHRSWKRAPSAWRAHTENERFFEDGEHAIAECRRCHSSLMRVARHGKVSR